MDGGLSRIAGFDAIARRALLASWLFALAAAAPEGMMYELAPTGTLRAAINLGNPVLATRGPTGEPQGVSMDLARALADELGVPLAVVPFSEARQVFQSAGAQVWDVAFLAVDPVRAAEIAFTAPYALIEGSYLVQAGSPLHAADEVDRDGMRIAVASGSAYDLYLTRTLRRTTIVRLPNADAAAALLRAGGAEVLAGIKQPLLALAAREPGARVLPGRFMTIGQAMGTPQGHPGRAAYLQDFVARAKASGLVAATLRAHGHADVPVADP